MTALLDRAVAELKKRPDREQDDVARDILARIGEPQLSAPSSADVVIGQSKAILRIIDPNDEMIDILTDADIASWYSDKLSAP